MSGLRIMLRWYVRCARTLIRRAQWRYLKRRRMPVERIPMPPRAVWTGPDYRSPVVTRLSCAAIDAGNGQVLAVADHPSRLSAAPIQTDYDDRDCVYGLKVRA